MADKKVTAGSVVVETEADNTKLEQGLKKTESMVNKTAGVVKKAIA